MNCKEVGRIAHVREPRGIVDQRAVHPRSSDCHHDHTGSQDHLVTKKYNELVVLHRNCEKNVQRLTGLRFGAESCSMDSNQGQP